MIDEARERHASANTCDEWRSILGHKTAAKAILVEAVAFGATANEPLSVPRTKKQALLQSLPRLTYTHTHMGPNA